MVVANAEGRRVLTGNLVSTVAQILHLFTGWYDDLAVRRMAKQIASEVQPVQRVMASQESAYLAQVSSVLSKRIIPPVGPIDVSNLRAGVPVDQVYARLAEQYRWDRSIGTAEDVARSKVLTRADVMNQTDVALAARAEAAAFFDANKVTGYRRVLHPELSKGGSCGLCIAASDRTYYKDQLLPIHARCVSGDTLVSAVGVQAMTRRSYAGPLIVLTTASSDQLTITPNHPVLTDKGWVPADLVAVGDDIIGSGRGQWAVSGRPDEEHRPASAEQVWRSLTVDHGLDARTMPLAAEDFHGDGFDGEVDVVLVDRHLPDVGRASFAQPAHHEALVSGGLRWPMLSSLSRLPEMVGVHGLAADGIVGGTGYGLTFGASSSDIAVGLSLTDPAPRDATLGQNALDHNAIHRMLGGQVQLRGSGHVLGRDLSLGQVISPTATRFDPAGFEFAGEGRRAYAELGRNLRNRLAADVSGDSVVEKRRIDGSHYVYNLQTVEGWYSANNYIVSNCHCGVMPIIGGFDAGHSLNNLDLADLYKAAGGSTSAAALKRTRWQVNEHGELGPVLAPKGADDRTAA